MTQEGNSHGMQSGGRDYKKELRVHCTKFMSSLQQYEETSDSRQREHLKGVLEEEFHLIRSAAKEFTHPGAKVQESKVEKDFRNYLMSCTPEDYSALYHDVQTLKDFTTL